MTRGNFKPRKREYDPTVEPLENQILRLHSAKSVRDLFAIADKLKLNSKGINYSLKQGVNPGKNFAEGYDEMYKAFRRKFLELKKLEGNRNRLGDLLDEWAEASEAERTTGLLREIADKVGNILGREVGINDIMLVVKGKKTEIEVDDKKVTDDVMGKKKPVVKKKK